MRSLFFASLLMVCTLLPAQTAEEYTQVLGLPDNLKETAGNMIRLQDGNLMLCGQWSDGLPFLQKMSPAGDVIFRRPYYLAGNSGVLSDLVEMPNGNLAATGGCRNCIPGDTGYALLSILTDAQGNLLQLRKHGSPGVVDYGYGIDRQANGRIVVAGQRPPYGLLYFYDRSLNLLDSLVFRMTGGTNEVAHDLMVATDGHIFVTGRTSIGSTPYLLLRKFTATGAEVWSRRLYADQTSAQVRGWRIRESAGGNVLVAGTRYNSGTPARGADMFLTEFAADTGAVVNERLFGSNSIDQGYALDVKGDRILMAGLIRQELGPGNLWRVAIYRMDDALNLIDSVVYDRAIMRDQPSGLAFLDNWGKDFAYCGISYSSSYLQQDIFWGRHFQRGRRAVIREFPRTLQLYPRDLNTNTAVLRVRAQLPDSTQPYLWARLHVYQDGQHIATQNQMLEYIGDTATIAFDQTITARLSNYTFELGLSNGLADHPEISAVHVVAGDAFLLTGQSNAVAKQRGTVAAPANPWLRTYGSSNSTGFPDLWFVGDPNADMNDPGNIGQLAASAGKEIVDKQQIPVAILNGGRNGAAIDYFRPNPSQSPMANNYGRALLRAQYAGLRDGIRAVIFWQGETDAFNGTMPAFYVYNMDSIRRSWLRDYPAIEQIYMFQVRRGCSAVFPGIARTLGTQFIYGDTVAGLHLLSTTGLDHLSDACHYSYPNGYESAGLQLYERMRPHLYGGPVLPNTTPPAPDSAWFPNCRKDTIRLAMRNTTDSYAVHAGIGQDFILSNTNVHVVSASMSGHVLTLALDDSLTGAATIAYFGHQGPAAPALLNANGIGLLSFNTIPVVCRQESPVVVRPPREHSLYSVRAQILRVGNVNEVETSETDPLIGYRLIDMYGRVILNHAGSEVRNARIQLPELAQGVYLLQMEYLSGRAEIRRLWME